MWKVGKKAAGRELDGRTWDQFPAAPAGATREPAIGDVTSATHAAGRMS